MSRGGKTALVAGAVGVAALGVVALACQPVRQQLVVAFTPSYEPTGDVRAVAEQARLRPDYEGRDADRPKIAVTLLPVGRGFAEVTDLQFPPGAAALAVVLTKAGAAHWLHLPDGASGPLFSVKVLTASEEGLLGLAFHPRFAENGRFFLNYVADRDGQDTTVIEEWKVAPGADLRTARPEAVRVLLEVAQPYPNHDAGQLAFGPDGMLYVGLGDGGYRADPHDNGQKPSALLGKMLRISVEPEGGRPYGVPADNPFVGKEGFRPELWALGLRNPWRYSFDGKGRLWVADVGQDRFEELDVVERGRNYGWKVREGRHCFEPGEGCRTEGLVDPVYEYDREDGQSVTGGFVYEGAGIPALAGKYVFGDFVRGRLWAIDPPAALDGTAPLPTPYALGKFALLPSTFGRDPSGELYVGDFASGAIYRLEPGEEAR